MVHSRDALIPTEQADGLVIVPREPTAAMLVAGNVMFADKNETPLNIWRAMVAAARPCRCCGGTGQERLCGHGGAEIVIPCSICAEATPTPCQAQDGYGAAPAAEWNPND